MGDVHQASHASVNSVQNGVHNGLKEQSRLDGVAIEDVEVNGVDMQNAAADAVIEDVEIR